MRRGSKASDVKPLKRGWTEAINRLCKPKWRAAHIHPIQSKPMYSSGQFMSEIEANVSAPTAAHSIVASRVPILTESPAVTSRVPTVPSRWATISFSIFIASTTAITSPFVTT